MFFFEMGIEEISVADLEKVAAQWLNKYRRTISPKTTSRRLTSMRVLGRLLDMVILKEYAAPTPAKPIPHPLPGGHDDLERMIEAANTLEQKALLALMGYCGLRVSEARSIGPADFNLHDMTLKVNGKGERERIIPVSKRAWEILCVAVTQAWVDRRPTVISYSDRSARDIVTKLGRRAQIVRAVSSHDLRATFATSAYNISHDPRAVQDLLGHASIVQTQVYIQTTMNQMRAAASFGDKHGD